MVKECVLKVSRFVYTCWVCVKRIAKEVGKVPFIAGIVALGFIGLQREELQWFAIALAALAVVIFWDQLALRRLKFGGVELERDVATPTSAKGPSDSRNDLMAIRDNFIYLGNHFLEDGRYADAFQFYRCAHNLKKSILTAFRALQCLCHLPDAAQKLGQRIRQWFEDAVWLSDGPWSDLEGRTEFVEHIKQLNLSRREADFTEVIVREMRSIQF